MNPSLVQYPGFVPQPYYYPNGEYGYYNVPYFFPQNQIYSNENWSYPNPHVSSITHPMGNQTPVSSLSRSVFSPDAPEFVFNQSNISSPPITEIPKSQNIKKTKKKKKKSGKKATEEATSTPEKTKGILVTNSTDKPSPPSKGSKGVQFMELENVVKETENSLMERNSPTGKPPSSPLDYSRLFKTTEKPTRNSDGKNGIKKSEASSKAEASSNETKPEENACMKSKVEGNSNIKTKSMECRNQAKGNVNVKSKVEGNIAFKSKTDHNESKPKTEVWPKVEGISNIKIKPEENVNVNSKPKPQGNTNVKTRSNQFVAPKSEPEGKVDIRPKLKENAEDSQRPKVGMSFADKLKSAPVKNPFLDWRDQRTKPTKCANNAVKSSNCSNPSEIPNPSNSPNPASDSNPSDSCNSQVSKASKSEADDFIQVSRRKNPASKPEASDASDDAEAKKKLEKQKKKLREKEKKKRLRDEKLLAQKLAPKGLKVSLISSKDMEKFKSSTSNRNSSSKSTPILKMNDSLFPSLGQSSAPSKVHASESESEWETTETEVIPKEPVVQPASSKNVKRSDPIQFDLMALITKKSNKKAPLKSDHPKKARTGVIANILDRNAPVLSRGKIRTKKRKLSEIRKALLLSKAKKKQIKEANPAESVAVSSSPSSSRTQQLHTKKFREYCDQILSDEIDTIAKDMLFRLRMFQDRAFQKDPIKGILKSNLISLSLSLSLLNIQMIMN